MRDQPRRLCMVVPDPGQDKRLLRVSSGHVCWAVSPSRAGAGRGIPTATPVLSSGPTGKSTPEVTDGSERVQMPAPGTTGQKAGPPASSVSPSQASAPDPALWARAAGVDHPTSYADAAGVLCAPRLQYGWWLFAVLLYSGSAWTVTVWRDVKGPLHPVRWTSGPMPRCDTPRSADYV